MAEYTIRVSDEIPPEQARSLVARLEDPLSSDGQFLFLRVPPGIDVAEASLRFRHVLAQMRGVAADQGRRGPGHTGFPAGPNRALGSPAERSLQGEPHA